MKLSFRVGLIVLAMLQALSGATPASAVNQTRSLKGEWSDKLRPETFPPDDAHIRPKWFPDHPSKKNTKRFPKIRPRLGKTFKRTPAYHFPGEKEIGAGDYAGALSEINQVLERKGVFRPRLIQLMNGRTNLETIKIELTKKETSSKKTKILLQETDETLARFGEAIYKERRLRLAHELGRQAIDLETRGESKEAGQRLDDIVAIHREGSFDGPSLTNLLVDLARAAHNEQNFPVAAEYYRLALDSISSSESPDDERLRVIVLEGLAEALNRSGESEKAEKIYDELRRR